jgi:hypothetical protein
MPTNALPAYDTSDNPTGCCPRFKPEGWDDQELHFEDKSFVKATTKSLFHIPVNMGSVFTKTFKAIENAHAQNENEFIVLSRDLSPWSAEHYFSVDRPVPDAQMVRLSGDYRTQVFEGPFKDAPKWQASMEEKLGEHGERAEETYFFYTTCPKCAKVYGKNYVVGVAKRHADKADLAPAAHMDSAG